MEHTPIYWLGYPPARPLSRYLFDLAGIIIARDVEAGSYK